MKTNKIMSPGWRILPLILVCILTSCGGDTPEEPKSTDENMFVSITIAGQKNTETRNSGEDSEDSDGLYGTDSENYINIDDLYILTFSIPEEKSVLDDNSKLLEILWPVSQERLDTTYTSVYSNGELVVLKTELNYSIPEYKNGNFCIVAVANANTFSPDDGRAKFDPQNVKIFRELRESALFEYKILDQPDTWSWKPEITEKKGIPMFGVKRVSLTGYDRKIFNEANPFPLASNGNSTVWLLRAFAKVTIELSDDLKNLKKEGVPFKIEIISAEIGNQYEQNFFLIPALSRMEGFANSGGTGQVATGPDFNGGSLQKATEGNNLQFSVSSDKHVAEVYLPEYMLKVPDQNITPPAIKLRLSEGGTEKEYNFEIRPYSENSDSGKDYWNYILRNYTYRFQVTIDFRIVTVNPTDWGDAYDNEYIFGNISTEDNNNDNGDDSGSEKET